MTTRTAVLHVSRSNDANWARSDENAPFAYRDLELTAATDGRFAADVSRSTGRGSFNGMHYHSVDFQMVYVLEGSATFYYEGEGEVRLSKGDFVHQPPGIRHRVIEVSDDCELLQVTAPARYETVELEPV